MTETEKRLTIAVNKNMSRGKYAAHAVHAALDFHGLTDHGAVIVLSLSPTQILEQTQEGSVLRDQGRTEVEPGTVTAGILKYETTETPVEYQGLSGEATHEEAAYQALRTLVKLRRAIEPAEEAVTNLPFDDVIAALERLNKEGLIGGSDG